MSNSNQEDNDDDNSGDNCDVDDDNDGRYDYLVSMTKLFQCLFIIMKLPISNF